MLNLSCDLHVDIIDMVYRRAIYDHFDGGFAYFLLWQTEGYLGRYILDN